MEITVLVLADPGLPSVVMAGDPGPYEVTIAVSHGLLTTQSTARMRDAPHDLKHRYRERYAGCDQIKGPYDGTRAEITLRVVVAPDNQDARMMSLSFEDEIVQLLEVIVITRQENSCLANCVAKMDRILVARQSECDRKDGVVSGLAQELRQQRLGQIVIDIQAHSAESDEASQGVAPRRRSPCVRAWT